ncbi:type II toxin-antitoxin system MqsR family toxin [Ammonifex thiophilus]|uniref:type II toxin-antitoxin system MqsR family toxin n=1 Tax=Ammonifex thiophilus TaxID=444093 RepID=UPI001402D6F2|nr:type II toxin-antitoxin system MqsR family toxin [Ammonifex thiophilus]
MRIVSSAQVVLFLVEFKKLVQGGRFYLVPRKENLEALALLGWTEEVLVEFLCSLTPGNYVGGPEDDRGVPGEDIWVFGAEIEGTEYYIKLKIRGSGKRGKAVCLSFHEAKRPLVYPHRNHRA